MVGSASRDGIWPTAGFFDLPQRLFPALLEADAEFSGYEPHVRPGQPADQDVADLVVDRIWPVHPAFLDEHALEAYPGRDRRDLAGVVGLHAADRNQRVAAFGQGIGDQVLQLARLITAVGDPRVAILALGPHRRAAQMGGLGLTRFDGHPSSGVRPRKDVRSWRAWGRSPGGAARSRLSSRPRSLSCASAGTGPSARSRRTST